MANTKTNPGAFRCYEAALPDEAYFVVLARDPAAPATLEFWAGERVKQGKVHEQDDKDRIAAAMTEAAEMAEWRQRMIDESEAVGLPPPWKLPRPANLDDGPPVRMKLPDTATHFNFDRAHALNTMIQIGDGPEMTLAELVDHYTSGRPAPRVWSRSDEDEDVEITVTPLSFTRMGELLDYATCYGEFDENTPSGTESKYGPDMSTPMNDMRRASIWTFKRCMGIIPEGGAEPPEADDFQPTVTLAIHAEGIFKVPGVDLPQPMATIGSVYAKAAELVGLTRHHQFSPEAHNAWCDLGKLVGWGPQPTENPPHKEGGPTNPTFLFLGQYEGVGLWGEDCPSDVAEKIKARLTKGPTLDTAPDDLAHAPEVPAHRFSSFHMDGDYAYARGLEVNPIHLPTALNAMAKSGWALLAIFGQTDTQHIGFVFERCVKPSGWIEYDFGPTTEIPPLEFVPFVSPQLGPRVRAVPEPDPAIMSAYEQGRPLDEIAQMATQSMMRVNIGVHGMDPDGRRELAKRIERLLMAYDGTANFRVTINTDIGLKPPVVFEHRGDPATGGHSIKSTRSLWPGAGSETKGDKVDMGRGNEP